MFPIQVQSLNDLLRVAVRVKVLLGREIVIEECLCQPESHQLAARLRAIDEAAAAAQATLGEESVNGDSPLAKDTVTDILSGAANMETDEEEE